MNDYRNSYYWFTQIDFDKMFTMLDSFETSGVINPSSLFSGILEKKQISFFFLTHDNWVAFIDNMDDVE